jgi:ectoine hydroxylase-related dioxygenase (phytanoyl-CoA dioxygenase family)
MFGVIRHPKLLTCIESLIGREIVGSSVYRVRPKIPGMRHGVVPWHQDSGYFMPHCDRDVIVTCWLPLVDATEENGCLQVITGAHRGGVSRHYSGGYAGYLEIAEEDLPEGRVVTVPVPLGGVLFMTNLTPHRSTENRTDVVRWSIDLRYQGADVPNNTDRPPETFDPNAPEAEIACYPPEGDFVIQSPSHPEREVRAWERFHEIRQGYEQAKLPYTSARRWTPMSERQATGNR